MALEYRVGILAALIIAGGIATAAISHAHEGHDLGIKVQIPLILTPVEKAGKEVYDAKCAACHGKKMEGTHKGPSLIPYDRAHHPDGYIARAIRYGSKQHHWNFGDMAPVEGITEEEIGNIITYVREIQAFNAEL